MSRPILGIDLDGVVFDWANSAVRTLRQYDYPAPSPDEWQGWNYLQENVSPEAWQWLWRHGLRNMFGNGQAYPGATTALHYLESKAHVAFLTQRPRKIADVTLDWLARHGLRPFAVVHLDGCKAHVFDCVAYVEDRPKNLWDLVDTGAKVFAPVRPWNQEVHSDPRIHSYEHWGEITSWAREAL